MAILTDTLRARLPPIHSQEAEEDPIVFAKFLLPGTALGWYPIEGQPEAEDYLFFGFVLGPDDFRFFRLSMLEDVRGPVGQMIEIDTGFTEGRLTEVVPAPDC